MQSVVMKHVEWAGSSALSESSDDFVADPARAIRGVRNLAALSLLFWVALGVLLLG